MTTPKCEYCESDYERAKRGCCSKCGAPLPSAFDFVLSDVEYELYDRLKYCNVFIDDEPHKLHNQVIQVLRTLSV